MTDGDRPQTPEEVKYASLLHRYLEGELTGSELLEFERLLTTHADLRQQLVEISLQAAIARRLFGSTETRRITPPVRNEPAAILPVTTVATPRVSKPEQTNRTTQNAHDESGELEEQPARFVLGSTWFDNFVGKKTSEWMMNIAILLAFVAAGWVMFNPALLPKQAANVGVARDEMMPENLPHENGAADTATESLAIINHSFE